MSTLLLAVACEQTTPPADQPASSAGARSSSGRTPEPDNTKINERDRGSLTQTPADQGQTPEDVRITQEIRKQVVAMDGASLNARNVKIITTGAQVTLRGPVDSTAERERVAAIARSVAGDTNVTDELEVTQP